MTEIFAAQSFIALSVNLGLGIYVIRKNPGSPTNRSFALLMLTFVIWDLSEGVLRLSSNITDMGFIRLWVNIEWIGIAAISGALLHFVLSYPRKRDVLDKWYAYPLIYGPPIVIIALIWTTDFVVSDVAMGWMGYDARVNLVGYAAPAVVYTVQIFLALIILLQTYTRSVGMIRNRSRVLLMGIAVPVIVGSFTETFLPFALDLQTRMGAGTIYTVIMGIFTAYAIHKHKLLVIEPTVEEWGPEEPTYKLELDHNYLLKGKSSTPAFRAFRNMVTQTPGLCITTEYPEKVKIKYGMEKTPIIWISKVSTGETALKPADLDFEVTQTILKFVKENRATSVLLDDIEYLNSVNGFEGTSKFVKRVSDVAATENSTLVVPLNPEALGERELAIIESNFDVVREMSPRDDLTVPEAAMNAVLYITERNRCYDAFRSQSPKIHIGTTHPRKIERKYSPGKSEYIWLTETKTDLKGSDPSQLNYEVLRKLSKFLETNQGGSVLFEGMEYLVSHVGFAEVLSFTQSAIDLVSKSQARLHVPLDRTALSREEVAVFQKRFDRID